MGKAWNAPGCRRISKMGNPRGMNGGRRGVSAWSGKHVDDNDCYFDNSSLPSSVLHLLHVLLTSSPSLVRRVMSAVPALPATHTPILQLFRLTRSTSSMTIDVLASGCQPVMRQRRSHARSQSRTSSRVFGYSTIVARSLISDIAYRAVAQCLMREVAE